MDRKAWIIVILCAVGIVLNTWYGLQHPPPRPPEPIADIVPEASRASEAAPAATPAPEATTPTPGGTPGQPAADLPEEKVELHTGSGAQAVTFILTNRGGGIARAEMYKADGSIDLVLNEHGKAPVAAFSVGADTFSNRSYRVVEKTASKVVFEAVEGDLVIHKEYSVDPRSAPQSDPHVMGLKVTITNKGTAKQTRSDCYLYTGAAAELRPGEIVSPSFVWNNAGDADQQSSSKFHDGAGMLGFGGPVRDFHKSFDRMRWTGVMSRFYTTLIATAEDQPSNVWANRFLLDHSHDDFKNNSKAATDYAIHGGLSLPPLDLDVGASKSFDFQIYMGPKIYHTLASLQPPRQQEFVMFYGYFGWFSRMFVFILHHFHNWTGNWGVAIVMLTFCIRMTLWPLQARSNSTMKRMALLQPKMKELQEKYKSDPTRMNTEVMKMYREYSVNPVSGCLPLFIQLPIFVGFYSMLQYAAELRGQPFVWWIKDLSLPDTVWHVPGMGWPVNVLPILMGITMVLQFKLTPQPQSADKMQQRIFMFMPFIFLYVSYSFASALALYWTFQNIISIAQAQIQRRYGKDFKLPPPGSGGGGGGSSGSRSPYGSQEKKKDKPSMPRLGGGGTKSRK